MRIGNTLRIAALSTLMAAPAAYAEVHQFSTCHLNEGKTAADARAFFDTFNAWAEKQKIPQPTKNTILYPFFGDKREQGMFVLYYVGEDFSAWGDALKGLWDDGMVYQSPWSANDAWTCTQVQVFWEPPESN